MPSNTVKTLTPWHFSAILLHVQGVPMRQIGEMVTPKRSYQAVKNLIHSDSARLVIDAIRNQTLDTIRAVQTRLQTIAPEMVEGLIEEARTASDAPSRVRAKIKLLEMAGHSPVQHHIIERPDAIAEEYDGMTEEQIKEKALTAIKAARGIKPKDKGPDGNLLQ